MCVDLVATGNLASPTFGCVTYIHIINILILYKDLKVIVTKIATLLRLSYIRLIQIKGRKLIRHIKNVK